MPFMSQPPPSNQSPIMTTNSQEPPSAQMQMRQHRRSRGLFPPEVIDIIVPPLQVGGWAGAAGVIAGVGGSIFKEANPVVWGMVSGFQWFTLGTSFWFTRTATIRAWGGEDRVTLADKTKASAISGAVAGAMGGLIRGPKNIVPAMLCWTVFGAGGQIVANRMATHETRPEVENNEGWMGSRWSPLKKLTDEEYINMMSEKMLRFEADIALIDERIADLRAAEKAASDGRTPNA